MQSSNTNQDVRVVEGFGREWSAYDQTALDEKELERIFEDYFQVFPWSDLTSDSIGFDLGCGSGRWARFVAPRVGKLHCIDPSEAALEVARRNLRGQSNCRFHLAGSDEIPVPDGSMDFGYSLGVLHHVPDTEKGIRDCVHKLKPGAPFLIYLYYAFDNRPPWFRWIWRASDIVRRMISALPFGVRKAATKVIALAVYLPTARLARLLERMGYDVEDLPLSAYRDRSFYTMCTDALDRFGTVLEQRFTKSEIQDMLLGAGLDNIMFSSRIFWAAVGYKRAQ